MSQEFFRDFTPLLVFKMTKFWYRSDHFNGKYI